MVRDSTEPPVQGPRIVLGIDYGTTYTGKPVHQVKMSIARHILRLLPQGWLGYRQTARMNLH